MDHYFGLLSCCEPCCPNTSDKFLFSPPVGKVSWKCREKGKERGGEKKVGREQSTLERVMVHGRACGGLNVKFPSNREKLTCHGAELRAAVGIR